MSEERRRRRPVRGKPRETRRTRRRYHGTEDEGLMIEMRQRLGSVRDRERADKASTPIQIHPAVPPTV